MVDAHRCHLGEIRGWPGPEPTVRGGRSVRNPIDHKMKLSDGQPLRCEVMTGLPTGRLADLIDWVREIVGHEWEKPPVGVHTYCRHSDDADHHSRQPTQDQTVTVTVTVNQTDAHFPDQRR